jgi:hypothetical protein
MPNRVVLDDAGLHALLESPDGPVGRDLLRRTLAVEARAVELCPVDEDRLRGSIDHEVGRDAEGLYGRVGTNVDYALDVERGTGLFEETVEGIAPSRSKGHRITPTSKQALAFTAAGGQKVVVRSIRGMHAQPFLRPALDAFDD